MVDPAPTAASVPAANLSAAQASPAEPQASPAQPLAIPSTVPVNNPIEADPTVCWPILLLSTVDTE